jgi:hypothetical protein
MHSTKLAVGSGLARAKRAVSSLLSPACGRAAALASSIAPVEADLVERANVVGHLAGRQCIERGIVGALPPQRRLDEAIDSAAWASKSRIDLQDGVCRRADHPRPSSSRSGIAPRPSPQPRVENYDDPLHVGQPQRKAFGHRHVAAGRERLRDLERIADGYDVNRP